MIHIINNNDIIGNIISTIYKETKKHVFQVIIECSMLMMDKIYNELFTSFDVVIATTMTYQGIIIDYTINNDIPNDWIIVKDMIFELNNSKTSIICTQ